MNKTVTQVNAYRPLRTSADLVQHVLTIHRWEPPADLAGVVEEFWQYDVRSGVGAVPIQIYPSGYSILRFNVFDERVDAYLYGPSLSAKMIGLFLEEFAIFGAAFKPSRAYQLMGLAMSELRDLRVDLEWVWPTLVSEVKERLWETTRFSERVVIMTDFLRETVRSDVAPLADFLGAFAAIGSGNAGELRRLAATHRVSPRLLRRYFDRYAGLSPKQVDRVIRFQGALYDLTLRPHVSLPDIAGRHGYADQAHFNREFKRLSNLTPAWLRNNAHDLADLELPIWSGLDRQHYYLPSKARVSFASGVR